MNEEIPTVPTEYAAPAMRSPRRPRAALVRLAVVATGLIFVSCAALIVYRGVTIDVPDAVLITRASPAWDGTIASVDGINLARPSEVTFDKHTKYTISFHLTPGNYTLNVRKGGKAIFTQDVALTKRIRAQVVFLPESLEGLHPTTKPAWPFGVEMPWSSRGDGLERPTASTTLGN